MNCPLCGEEMDPAGYCPNCGAEAEAEEAPQTLPERDLPGIFYENLTASQAEGEREYMKILSQAYEEEERREFYSFVRSLEALKASMQGENKTVILSSDSPIAQIFEGK